MELRHLSHPLLLYFDSFISSCLACLFYTFGLSIFIAHFLTIVKLLDGLFPLSICRDFISSNFGLESSLSDMSVAITALLCLLCVWWEAFHPLVSQCLCFFAIELGSFRQQVVWPCFCVFCLKSYKSFTLRVTIDMNLLIPRIGFSWLF